MHEKPAEQKLHALPLSPCEDLHVLIAKRAYELYGERGYRDGSALDDWLDAEREILSQIPPVLSSGRRAPRCASSSRAEVQRRAGPGRPAPTELTERLRVAVESLAFGLSVFQCLMPTFYPVATIPAGSPQSDSLPSRDLLRCVPSERTRNAPRGEARSPESSGGAESAAP